MLDIELYDKATNSYDELQNTRPDYVQAVNRAIELAVKYLNTKSDIVIVDFCCGTGQITKKLAEAVGGAEKVTLIDINEHFLRIAMNLGIKTKKIEAKNNVLSANLKPEADIVLAMFAYHHMPDADKETFLKQARNALKPQGLLLLGEIYSPDRETTIRYYENLYDSIPKEKQSPELEKFLTETAESEQFEFKVVKSFADKQLTKNGFILLQSDKIFPKDETFSADIGTFVEVWKV